MRISEQIHRASQIGIGYILGCEDAARERVKRLFKKSNDINYKKLDSDYILNSDNQYEKENIRYNKLLNKMFDAVLTDKELIEFNYLNDKIGSYTKTYFTQRIIQLSTVAINAMSNKVKKNKNTSLKALKMYFDTYIKHTVKRAYFCIIGVLMVHNGYTLSMLKYIYTDISPPKILLE